MVSEVQGHAYHPALKSYRPKWQGTRSFSLHPLPCVETLRSDELYPQDLKEGEGPDPQDLFGWERSSTIGTVPGRALLHPGPCLTPPPPSLLRPSGSGPTDEEPHFKQQRTFERPFALQEHRRRPRERVLQSAFRLGPWGSGPRRQSTYVTGTTEGRRQAGYQGPGPADREERARSVTRWKAARVAAERARPLPSQRMGETGQCREGCPGHSPPAQGAQVFLGSRSLQANPEKGTRGEPSV